MNVTLRHCARCEKEFSLPPTKAARARVFCSPACHMADRADHQITITCAQCGKVFQSVKALAERKRFCSKVCHRAFYRMGETEQRICPICQRAYISVVGKVRGHLTCSPECAKEARQRGLKLAQKVVKRPKKKASSKVSRVCERCNTIFLAFPSRKGRYCSRRCAKLNAGVDNQGILKTSTMVQCDYCGKERKVFQCRKKPYRGTFCNMQCYLSSNQSGAERRVAAWLDAHHIPYQRQYKLGHRTVDFWVNGMVIEVNGCYWHACAQCQFTILNDAQRRRVTSDKALHTYCEKRSIPLLTIWEHDINNDNYTAIAAIRPS